MGECASTEVVYKINEASVMQHELVYLDLASFEICSDLQDLCFGVILEV